MSKLQPAFLTCHKWRKGLHICAKGHHRWKVNSQWIQPRNIENRKVSCQTASTLGLWDRPGTAMQLIQSPAAASRLSMQTMTSTTWIHAKEAMQRQRMRIVFCTIIKCLSVSVSCIVSGCFVQSIHLRASLGPWTSWTLDSLECISNAKLRRFKLFALQN